MNDREMGAQEGDEGSVQIFLEAHQIRQKDGLRSVYFAVVYRSGLLRKTLRTLPRMEHGMLLALEGIVDVMKWSRDSLSPNQNITILTTIEYISNYCFDDPETYAARSRRKGKIKQAQLLDELILLKRTLPNARALCVKKAEASAGTILAGKLAEDLNRNRYHEPNIHSFIPDELPNAANDTEPMLRHASRGD